MVFNEDKWPVLKCIEENYPFEKAFLSRRIRNKYNPYDNKKSWEFLWTFWNRFIDEPIQHFYISKKIHHLVDYDEKMYPILQKEVYKPEYHRPFLGTINYTIQDPNTKPLNFTVLLEIPPKEETGGKHAFAMAVFQGSPSIFLGLVLAEDYGDKSNIVNYIADEPVLQAFQETYTFCKQFLYFLDHVDVQEKYTLTQGHSRIKTKNGEKYKSYMPNIDVNVIDSTYYTRTIRKGEFKVSGHWRMQPCGPGKRHRKLTFIDEYVKHGLTRKAKVENINN